MAWLEFFSWIHQKQIQAELLAHSKLTEYIIFLKKSVNIINQLHYDHHSDYMAPEYVMEGLFSMKSDVFSFGVLILEILSGRKINSYTITLKEPRCICK